MSKTNKQYKKKTYIIDGINVKQTEMFMAF